MANVSVKLVTIFEDFWVSALEVLPDLAVATLIVIVFWALSRGVRWSVTRLSQKWAVDPSIQNLLVTGGTAITVGVGVFAASAVLFPGLSAGDLVSVLGLGGVAIGFAFKDIFQNFLAGVLILGRRPFHIGDYISANGLEGYVEDVSFRNTLMRTLEGHVLIVPNADIFTNPVSVQTARAEVRSTFNTGVAYHTDIERAREVLLSTVRDIEGVRADPEPQALVSEYDASSVNFEIRYWTSSNPSEKRAVLDRVATRVKVALEQAGIEIPFPQRVLHFADPRVADLVADAERRLSQGAQTNAMPAMPEMMSQTP